MEDLARELRNARFAEPPSAKRSWMLFVDGENLEARGKAYLRANAIEPVAGPYFRAGVFLWFPPPGSGRTNFFARGGLQHTAVRAHYYTSTKAGEPERTQIRAQLRDLGFDPWVVVKGSSRASKGVDIKMTTDILANAYLNTYEVAVLLTGDGDYVPVVEWVKQLGKLVWVLAVGDKSLNQDLRLAADQYVDLGPDLLARWRSTHPAQQEESSQNAR